MSTYIINKYSGFLFLVFTCANFIAQDTLQKETALKFSCKKVAIKHNDFYYNENKIKARNLCKLINSSMETDEERKKRLVEDINTYSALKSNKNAFPIIASSAFILGAGFSYLTFIVGGRTDVVILTAIFGTASVGFTIGSIINTLKFKKKKKELIRQLAL